MFKNYLLTAIKVLQRRKFFTFVNVFGIAITLAILTAVTAIFDSIINPRGAEQTSHQFVALNEMILTNEERTWTWSSAPGYRFIRDYMLDLETPQMTSIYSGPVSGTTFMNGQKNALRLKRTDGNYWKILDFDLISGRLISDDEVTSGQMVAVINDATQKRLFNSSSALGKNLTVNSQTFEIIGVVADEPELSQHAFGDIWVPYTTHPSSSFKADWMGNFRVLFYHEDPSMMPRIKQEVDATMKSFDIEGEPFSIAIGSADTKLDEMARELFNNQEQQDSGADKIWLILLGGALAFMLLPTINLINLNVSRIMERSSEIGVRRSFGAARGDLVCQFMVENLLLTLIGGLVGVLLGIFALDIVEQSGLIRYAQFSINWRIFLAALGLIFLFSLLSGAYPAWKMSRVHPVAALKRSLDHA